MKRYVVMALKEHAQISMFGRIEDLPISQMSDGCIGALLVFQSKSAARRYAGKRFEISEIIVEPTEQKTKGGE